MPTAMRYRLLGDSGLRVSELCLSLASLDVKLTPQHVASLDAASAISLGFPHEFYQNPMVRTFAHGGLRDRIITANR